MSTHNICFHGEIRKILTWYLLLSRPRIQKKSRSAGEDTQSDLLHIYNLLYPLILYVNNEGPNHLVQTHRLIWTITVHACIRGTLSHGVVQMNSHQHLAEPANNMSSHLRLLKLNPCILEKHSSLKHQSQLQQMTLVVLVFFFFFFFFFCYFSEKTSLDSSCESSAKQSKIIFFEIPRTVQHETSKKLLSIMGTSQC